MNFLAKEQVLELLSRLIAIPSVNPNLEVGAGNNEMNIALFVCEWLLSHGINAVVEEVEPGRANVFAEVDHGYGPTLCLCAHLDTVGVKEMTISPFHPQVEGNRVYGRGSCDMKGGVAAIMSAAAALSQEDFKGKLILALVCDEEYASIGAYDFVQRHSADACILTEPSDLQVVTTHKGFLCGKVTTKGRCAHGSRWDIGQSAISKMGWVLVALDKLDKECLRKRTDPLLGPASMHVSLIRGGTGVSTYASDCEIHIERRTLASEDLAQVKHELEEAILSSCSDAEIDWYLDRPAAFCSEEQKIVKCVKAAHRVVMGGDAKAVGWGVWTDAAVFQQAGIPTVNLGPSGFGLHEPVEWVDLDSVVLNAEILCEAARLFWEK